MTRTRARSIAGLAIATLAVVTCVPTLALASPAPDPAAPTPTTTASTSADATAPAATDATTTEAAPSGGATPAADATPASAAPTQAPASDARVVTYLGVTVPVPAQWQVVYLDGLTEGCVRLDEPTVYLGPAPANSTCPAQVEGRANVLWLHPTSGARATTFAPGDAAPDVAAFGVSGEWRAVLSGTGLTISAFAGADPAELTATIGGITISDASLAAGTAANSQALDGTAASGGLTGEAAATVQLPADFTRYSGLGFDTCDAPSLATMRAWKASSPYGSVGIYFGGKSRGCANQTNLSPSWVKAVYDMGWRIIPIYVGSQASCRGGSKTPMIVGQEWAQGWDEARDAVVQAGYYGIGPGSDLYFDMENYPTGAGGCSDGVMTFLSAWTQNLHNLGYNSGVYSSAASGIKDLATYTAAGRITGPDRIWIARWDGIPHVFGHTTYVPDTMWANYQRIHQYTGGHVESYGGASVNIDSNMLLTDPSVSSGDLYRFYKNDGTHFYTASAAEAEKAKGYPDYKYEGIAGTIVPLGAAVPAGYVPLYRFYKFAAGTHFYTTSEYEANQVKGYSEYKYEGVVGYVAPTNVAGTVAMHRFYKTDGTHFYTASQYEANLVKGYRDYKYENEAFYLTPPR